MKKMDTLNRVIAAMFLWATGNLLGLLSDLMPIVQNAGIIIGFIAGCVALFGSIQLIKKRRLEIEKLTLENKKLSEDNK